MSNQIITKRGIESALYVCPLAVATTVKRERSLVGSVSPLQGTGLPVAGLRRAGIGNGTTDAPVRSMQQFVPFHPGDTARRPPA
jgi:hypothetical protein